MNKKGFEFGGVGTLVIVAVAIIVVMSLIPTIASNISTVTNKVTISNEFYTFPNSSAAVNYVTLKGQAASSVTVKNRTGDITIPASNYTVTNYILNNGVLVTRLTAKDLTYLGYLVNVSYTSEPFGYDTNSGGRAITDLILVLAGVAVVVVVVKFVTDNEIFSFG